MSPALSLSFTHLPLCKSQELSKVSTTTPLPKTSNKENPTQKTPLDTKLSRRKLLNTLNSTGLGLTVGSVVAQPARAEPETPIEATSTRLSHSRFLQYLDEGAVRKVDLFENGSVAIAEVFNPALNKIQRVKVQLPGLPQELLRKLREKHVDFAAHPMELNMVAAILDLLGNLAFPLILLGSLLLRTSSGNTPGGPNLPFGLGRFTEHDSNRDFNMQRFHDKRKSTQKVEDFGVNLVLASYDDKEALRSMYKQEFIFCEQVNERLRSSDDYQAFLKCLHIYSTEIITKKYLQSLGEGTEWNAYSF